MKRIASIAGSMQGCVSTRGFSIRFIFARFLVFFLTEWLCNILLCSGLRVIIIVPVADRLVIFADRAFALPDHVPGIAAIDVRPDFDPIGPQVSAQRLVESIK